MSENEASLTSVSLQLSLPQEVKVVYILPSGLNLGKREREGSIGRGGRGAARQKDCKVLSYSVKGLVGNKAKNYDLRTHVQLYTVSKGSTSI